MLRCYLGVLSLLLFWGGAHGEVSLHEDMLSLDALVWAGCRWHSSEQGGFASRYSGFYRGPAQVGLTGRIASVASVRLSADVTDPGGRMLRDLYVEMDWPCGIVLCAGQFIPPLGFEALTEPSKLKVVDYSLNKSYWKPMDARDVGAGLGYRSVSLNVFAAVVNGNGLNSVADDNDWKDLAARVAFRFDRFGVTLASRGYYGSVGTKGDLFRTWAAELAWAKGPLEFIGEYQNSYWLHTVNSFYGQASYRIGPLEPTARAQMAFHWDDKYELGLTAALNLYALHDNIKVMVDFDYWRKATDRSELRGNKSKMDIRLQGRI